MNALRTAVLEHTTANGVHYDWLIEDPRLPDLPAEHAGLWTARIPAPPPHWLSVERTVIQVLTPHRRAYLSYQGEVSNRRGRVRRVAEGTCHASLWSADRIVMQCEMNVVSAVVELRRLGGERWQACFTPRLR